MNRAVRLALVMLPLLCGLLSGCVVYERGPAWHHP
jgi:hypothetical protein